MVTSYFRPELEIWPFRACAVKNVQYNRYYRNSSVTVDLATGQVPRSTESIYNSVFVVRLRVNAAKQYSDCIYFYRSHQLPLPLVIL